MQVSFPNFSRQLIFSSPPLFSSPSSHSLQGVKIDRQLIFSFTTLSLQQHFPFSKATLCVSGHCTVSGADNSESYRVIGSKELRDHPANKNYTSQMFKLLYTYYFTHQTICFTSTINVYPFRVP